MKNIILDKEYIPANRHITKTLLRRWEKEIAAHKLRK